jgi:sortase (surface protein transpeptidase)
MVAGVTLVGCGTNAPSTRPATTAAAPATPSAQVHEGLSRSVPTSVDIPSIDAKSSLVQLGLNADKTVQVPPVSQPLQAGWYKYSPTPGEVGPSVILGHIDGNRKEGIFWRLHDLKPGATVVVDRQDGSSLTFVVTKVDEVSKDVFPTSAVYGNTTDPQLRLITCGGAFDAAAHSYLDNIVVYATLST